MLMMMMMMTVMRMMKIRYKLSRVSIGQSTFKTTTYSTVFICLHYFHKKMHRYPYIAMPPAPRQMLRPWQISEYVTFTMSKYQINYTNILSICLCALIFIVIAVLLLISILILISSLYSHLLFDTVCSCFDCFVLFYVVPLFNASISFLARFVGTDISLSSCLLGFGKCVPIPFRTGRQPWCLLATTREGRWDRMVWGFVKKKHAKVHQSPRNWVMQKWIPPHLKFNS